MSLPLIWVDHIFEKLTVTYGQQFLGRWRDVDLNAVKQAGAGRNRLHADHPWVAQGQLMQQRTADQGFAHAGIGAGNKKRKFAGLRHGGFLLPAWLPKPQTHPGPDGLLSRRSIHKVAWRRGCCQLAATVRRVPWHAAGSGAKNRAVG